MSENLYLPENGTKSDLYEAILPQVEALISTEEDLYANLSNIAAALKQAKDFLWVGFYLVKGDQLVLGPFQGPIACTRINMGKGVCGTAWQERKSLLVADVDAFPGHIACSSASKSELVVPIFKGDQVFGVLDIDSEELAFFDEVDKKYMEKLMALLSKTL